MSMGKSELLIIEEIKKGIIDVETDEISGIDNFEPGYIDKENEVISWTSNRCSIKENSKSIWWNENG